MNIVIIGAGDIGRHLAEIFSALGYGIVLVDNNPSILEKTSRELDVATRHGSGTNWELLEELLELSPDLLIALTGNDETNLIASSIAKNLGYPRTIARVRSNYYFSQSRLNFERMFNVDYLIGPEMLTGNAIATMILIPQSVAQESFAHGSILLRTVKVPSNWRKGDIPLWNVQELELPANLMVGLINRKNFHYVKGKPTAHREQILFPHGKDMIKPNDEVTFIGEAEAVNELHKFFGAHEKIPDSVVIVGGSLIGINLARKLQDRNIRVRILEKDFEKCTLLSEKLPYCTIIHRDGTDYKFLQAEKIGEAKVFVACTRSDEVNFLAGSIAKELGAERVIISLTNTDYLPLIEKVGISHAVSPRIHAANRILSIAREKTIASMVSMYNNQAEIMEVKVSTNSKVAGIPLKYLGKELPTDFLIVMVQSRGRIFIADGNRVLSPGDTAVVISHPRHINDIKKLFG